MATARYEKLTESWSDTSVVVYHAYDPTMPNDWNGEPMGIVFSSENEAEVDAKIEQLNAEENTDGNLSQ